MKPRKPILSGWILLSILFVLWCIFRLTGIVGFYKVPSTSMAPNLSVGSFLMSKQVPQYLLADIEDRKANNRKARLAKKLMPSIKQDDLLFFKYPEGDTISQQYQSNVSYYQLLRDAEYFYVKQNDQLSKNRLKQLARKKVWSEYDIVYKSLYKRTIFIKRCVGLPGQTIEVINSKAYINDSKPSEDYECHFGYTSNQRIGIKALESCSIKENKNESYFDAGPYNNLTESEAACLNEFPSISLTRTETKIDSTKAKNCFPFDDQYFWTVDYFGPLTIPKKGTTILLTSINKPIYERLVNVYELDDIDQYIDQQIPYEFKMNYYFVMGDNRHNSIDSRFWGFVPESHVMGKPILNFKF